ncbi:COG4695 Phage-related protein [uncultured Caudovirales phage]|uniref:COG4695 Phage-related protein n=1 Tax=uncultured Caudovirales phage TaxID=2100421 RepID=A0A6J5R683_9CAUD|nr:COG4695 Phage-related protein [uncultured Caudovirales phage]
MSRTETIGAQLVKPSMLSRVVESVRAYTLGPLTSRSPELAKYFNAGGPSKAGVAVNEYNIQNVSAVWAAVGLISDDVASLPLMLYRRNANGGKTTFEAHPLYRLLHDEPNPEMSSMVFRRTMMAHCLIWQNAYAEIERDNVGRPLYLWPLSPDNVRVERDARKSVVYIVSNPNGGESIIPAADMIHLVGRSHDGTVGSSIVERAKESIGLAIAAEQFGCTFFGNGATFGGVISFKGPKPTEMSDENYRQQLEARHQGVKRAHKLLALYNDASYTETGVEPDSAQFLETRTFQIREVARWFKIPPHKLADLADATFSNVEQMNTEYYTSAIRPWLVLWEQELTRKLVAKLERSQQFVEHSIEGFLRGDTAARSAFYTALFNIGALTINEVRGYENLNPLAGGDESFVQVNNLMPLSRVNDYAEALIESMAHAPDGPPVGPHDGVIPTAPVPPVDGGVDPVIEEMSAALAGIEQRLAENTDTVRLAQAAVDARNLELADTRSKAEEQMTALKVAWRDELTAAKSLTTAAERRYDAAVARFASVATGHRAMIADALGRLLQREADRARKAQATPEKLRAWVEMFYPLHADTCRAALRPVVLAWAACAGADADAVLADLVRSHVETSRVDLLTAADTDDADEFAANLARVVSRWEHERIDATADGLLARRAIYIGTEIDLEPTAGSTAKSAALQRIEEET